MQLPLLQATLSNSRLSFICNCYTWPTHALPLAKTAWTRVIASEPIFQRDEHRTGHDGSGHCVSSGSLSPPSFKSFMSFTPPRAISIGVVSHPHCCPA